MLAIAVISNVVHIYILCHLILGYYEASGLANVNQSDECIVVLQLLHLVRHFWATVERLTH